MDGSEATKMIFLTRCFPEIVIKLRQRRPETDERRETIFYPCAVCM